MLLILAYFSSAAVVEFLRLDDDSNHFIMIIVLFTFLISVTKYLVKAAEGKEALFGSQIEGTAHPNMAAGT